MLTIWEEYSTEQDNLAFSNTDTIFIAETHLLNTAVQTFWGKLRPEFSVPKSQASWGPATWACRLGMETVLSSTVL